MTLGFETNTMMLATTGGGVVAIKLAVAMAFSIAWLFLAPKVNADAIVARVNRELWSGLVLLAGAFGLILWLVIPAFILGLVLFVLLNLAVLTAYLLHRNSQVDPEYRLFTREWFDARKGIAHREMKVETRLKLYDSIGRAILLTESELKDKRLVQSYNLTQALLYDITYNRAGEVDLAPTGDQVSLRYVIDGVVSTREPISNEDSEFILPFLLEKAGIDMKSKGHSQVQKGKITVDLANSPINVEIIAKDTVAGPHIRIRVIQQLVQTNIDILGMQPNIAQKILKLTEKPGLLLVAGPPKSGVTSTMYSILRKQDAYMKLLMTVEAKSPLDMENVTQHEYGNPANLPNMLATTMRRDPDVIMVDQCPDAKTARLICDYSAEKVVLLHLPAKDAFSALLKWIKLMGGSRDALTPIRGILCQRLIRSLCPSCKRPYTADAQTQAKLNHTRVRAGISEPIQEIYRCPEYPQTDEKGRKLPPCETCQDTGFYGRVGVFEFLPIDDDLQKLMRSKATVKQLKGYARKGGMMDIYEQALCKVTQGITSIQEVLRLCKPEARKE